MADQDPESHSGLPIPLTPLVGREREVAEVAALLRQEDARLVTLTGPGGVGKTRLALAVGAGVAGDYFDEVRFVGLAPLTDPALVPSAVAQALGVREDGDAPRSARIVAVLRDRRMLLVLDNFEQVVEAATLASDLLAACPVVKVLVTSRVRLRVSGEFDYPVPPLGLPGTDGPTGGDLAESEAARLFEQRARAIRPGFAVTQENADAVAAICRRLDGLPLAIELAAARVKVLPPAALLARLDRALPLLTGGNRDLPARQQTVRDTVAWSHDLLPPAERALFRRLAVFVGGFTLEAAEAVAGDDGGDVLDGVTVLVENSLLRPVENPGGEPRYAMLETVREFGLEPLEASGEETAIRDAHLAWSVAFAERTCPTVHGPGAAAWLDRLEPEHDNLRAALTWSLERGDAVAALRLAGALRDFWYLRGHRREGRRWLEAALAIGAGAPARLRARALLGRGWLDHDARDSGPATAALGESLDLYRGLGDRLGQGLALDMLGVVAEDHGAYGEADRLMAEARACFEGLGDRALVRQATYHLGVIALGQGDPDRALARFAEVERTARAEGDHFNLANALWYRGLVHCIRGEPGQAADALEEALAAERQLGTLDGAVPFFANLAVLAVAAGGPEAAARLLGTVAGEGERLGLSPNLPEREHHDRARVDAEAALGAPAFRAAWEAGWARTLEASMEDVADVLTAARARPSAAKAADPAGGAGLTRRELEVLRLVAQGKSDREIAAELFVAYRTVTSCVAGILRKLDAPSRTAAAAWAIKHGLA